MTQSLPILLLAEDDEDHYFIAQKAYEDSGIHCQLERVSQGEELLDYLFKHPFPQLILLDMNMPKVDGREVLSILQKNPEWKKIPVIVLTTSPNEEDQVFCLQKGAKQYLQKPISFSELVQIFKSCETWLRR